MDSGGHGTVYTRERGSHSGSDIARTRLMATTLATASGRFHWPLGKKILLRKAERVGTEQRVQVGWAMSRRHYDALRTICTRDGR